MNFQHIQELRQVNAGRRPQAMHTQMRTASNAGAKKIQDQYREQEALFEQVLRNGYGGLSNAQKTAISNAMSTVAGSEGGYTAPATVSISICDALSQHSSMRRVSTVLITDAGENSSYPSSDGRDETGEQLGQNASSSLLDVDFGAAALNTYRYGSKVIAVPVQLIQDTSIDLLAFLEQRIAARLGRITNSKFTTGSGTGEPMGVVTAATVGKTGASGQTATVLPDDLEDLIHAVDPAYRESEKCGWMMHDSTLQYIAKLKDSTGHPLNLVRYGHRALGVPTLLNGYPVETNQDMAVMAANAKSILFGDFGQYVIRDVLGTTVRRFDDSAFATKGQVGFLGTARAGGAYVDIGGAIKAYRNAAS